MSTETLSDNVTRAEIIIISGITWARLKGAVLIMSYGFPEPCGRVKNNKMIYKRAAVMAWFEKNDVKTMRLPVMNSICIKSANKKPVIDKATSIAFLSGKLNEVKPKPKRRPWTRTVHLKEMHPEMPLNPNFSRSSWGATDHLITINADHY